MKIFAFVAFLAAAGLATVGSLWWVQAFIIGAMGCLFGDLR